MLEEKVQQAQDHPLTFLLQVDQRQARVVLKDLWAAAVCAVLLTLAAVELSERLGNGYL
jgi:hypothetical protein